MIMDKASYTRIAMKVSRSFICVCFPAVFIFLSCSIGIGKPSQKPDATIHDEKEALRAVRGYRFLIDTPLLNSDFNEETFDSLWEVWPTTLKEKARAASPEVRRKMAFQR